MKCVCLTFLLSVHNTVQDLQERDLRDSTRSTAPLKPAEDAHILDTSHLTAQEVVDAASAIIRKACPALKVH